MGMTQALVVLTVGICTGIGLVIIFDKDRVVRAGKRIARLAASIRETVSEHRTLSAELEAGQDAVNELKQSIINHHAERAMIEQIFVTDCTPLKSTSRVHADEAIVYGRGSEWVYLYTFATQEELARERRQKNFPMKLGMSTQNNVVTRVDQQVSGNSTALSERAILRLVFRVNNSRDMESWMHRQLDKMGRKVENSIGVEWYNTNPSEVEQLFRAYVLQFSRSNHPVVSPC